MKIQKIEIIDSKDRKITVENYSIQDSVSAGGNVKCIFNGLRKPLILWQGTEYDKNPSYTNEDIKKRVEELIGPNPKDVLEKLL